MAQLVGRHQKDPHDHEPIGPARHQRRDSAQTHVESGLCPAKGVLDLSCAVGPRAKMNPKYRSPSGEGTTGRPARMLISTPTTPRGEGPLLSRHLVEHPGRADRDHHDARRPGLPGETVERHTERVTDDDLFEADPRPEPQGPGAQAADGAGGQLEHGRRRLSR